MYNREIVLEEILEEFPDLKRHEFIVWEVLKKVELAYGIRSEKHGNH